MEKKKLDKGISDSESPSSDYQWCQTSLKDKKHEYICSECKRTLVKSASSLSDTTELPVCKCGVRSKVPLSIKRGSVEVFDGDLSTSAFNHLISQVSIAYDFETGCVNPSHPKPCDQHCALDSTKGELQQVQMCDADGNTFIIRVQKMPSGYSSCALGAEVISNVPVKLVHYSRFELTWSRHFPSALGLNTTGQVLCTRIGSQILRPDEKGHSLDDLVYRHLGHKLDKSDEVYLHGWNQNKLTDRQIEYSVNDVVYLHRLTGEISRELSKQSSHHHHKWYEMCDIQKQLCIDEILGLDRKVLGRV